MTAQPAEAGRKKKGSEQKAAEQTKDQRQKQRQSQRQRQKEKHQKDKKGPEQTGARPAWREASSRVRRGSVASAAAPNLTRGFVVSVAFHVCSRRLWHPASRGRRLRSFAPLQTARHAEDVRVGRVQQPN